MAVQHEYDITTTSSEADALRYSVRKVFLEISQNSTGKHLCQRACNFIKKETLAQVFSYEFCDVSKNIWWLLICRVDSSSNLVQKVSYG